MQVLESERRTQNRVESKEEGKAVYSRLDRYLFALGVEDKAARDCALAKIRDRVAQRLPDEPSRPLAKLANEEMEHLMQAWWTQLCSEESLPCDVPSSAREKIALFLADMPLGSQSHFLQAGPFPSELTKAARSATIRPHPDLQRAAMVPQALDLGPINKLAALRRNPIFKLATGAAWLFGLIMAVFFLFTHL